MIIRKIKQIIVGILKAIYSILCVFNLQFALLVALVGIVFRFTGLFDKYSGLLIGLCVAFVFSIFLAFYLTLRKLFGSGNMQEKSRKIKIIKPKPEREDNQLEQQIEQPSNAVETQLQQVIAQPIYYRVKQNPNYIMAEYPDRYELYFKGAKGLQKIRTDYKG